MTSDPREQRAREVAENLALLYGEYNLRDTLADLITIVLLAERRAAMEAGLELAALWHEAKAAEAIRAEPFTMTQEANMHAGFARAIRALAAGKEGT